MKPASFIAALSVLGVAACASAPELEVSSRGRLPTASAIFVLGDPGEGDSASAEASTAVQQALMERGWSLGTDNAAWRVETSYSERPSSVGAYPGETAPAAGSEDWRIPPAARPWWRRERLLGVLVVRILHAENGSEAVRAEAKRRIDRGQAGAEINGLAAAAVAEALGGPAGSSAASGQ